MFIRKNYISEFENKVSLAIAIKTRLMTSLISNKPTLLHRRLGDEINDGVENDSNSFRVGGAGKMVVDFCSASLPSRLLDARSTRLAAADDLKLVEDEVAHLLVVLRAAVVGKAAHERVHRDVVTTAAAEKFFAENVFLVEENDHGRVYKTLMISDRFEKLQKIRQ